MYCRMATINNYNRDRKIINKHVLLNSEEFADQVALVHNGLFWGEGYCLGFNQQTPVVSVQIDIIHSATIPFPQNLTRRDIFAPPGIAGQTIF